MENIRRHEHLLILVSAVTGCFSIYAFASLVAILVGIINFAIGIQICTIMAVIKTYKSIIKTLRKSMIK